MPLFLFLTQRSLLDLRAHGFLRLIARLTALFIDFPR